MSGLRVGYGEKVITPPLGIDLCGYGFYLDRKAESVLDELKARAVFLRSNDQTLILVSADIIGFTVEDADAIRVDIAAAHGIPRASVLLAATHTHSGPATQPLPGLGEVDAAYMKRLRTRIVEAAAGAAIAAGATLAITSDSHRAEMLDRQMRLGIIIARRPCAAFST